MDNRNDDKNYLFYRTVIGAILMIFVCAPLFWRYGAGYGALMLVIGGMMAIAAVVQYVGIRKKKKAEENKEEKKKK